MQNDVDAVCGARTWGGEAGHWGSGGWSRRKRGNRPGRSYRTDAGAASTRRMKSESPTLVIIRAQKAPTATPAKNGRAAAASTDATKPTLLTLIAPNLGSFSPRCPPAVDAPSDIRSPARCRRRRDLAVVMLRYRADAAYTPALHVARRRV